MSDYSVCPEGGFWEEADRPTLSDAINDSRRVLDKWNNSVPLIGAAHLATALEELIARAQEADDALKEYR